MRNRIEISYRTFFFILFLIAAVYFIIQIKDILFLLFVSFIIMSAVKPIIDRLEKFYIPRIIGIAVVYILIIGLIIASAGAFVPPLIQEYGKLSDRLTVFAENIIPGNIINIENITQNLKPLGENIFKISLGVFSNIISFASVLILSLYMVLERKYLEVNLSRFMGSKGADIIINIITKVEERLGSWVRGQLALGIIIGVMTFTGLTLIGIPYAFPLALIAGMLEVIPNVGPVVAAIPAVLVAATISPVYLLVVVLLYVGVQQFENNLLVPVVMRKAVGLPPLVTLLALMVGAKLAGIVGAILAVPLLVTIETVVISYFELIKRKDLTIENEIETDENK